MKELRLRQKKRKEKETFNTIIYSTISLIITIAAAVTLFNSSLILIPGLK